MSKVLIAGGGAAGMFAAVFAAENGHQVHLFEQNEKLGKKLFITGKGRCNFTNACSMEELFDNVMTNAKFLYSAFYGYNNYDTIDFFESLGVPCKVERGNRVFPRSDKSSDIIAALERRLKALDVKIHLRSKVKSLWLEAQQLNGLVLENGAQIAGDAVLVATGGLSYPTTGAAGDGYRFAASAGHQVVACRPALVPLETKEDYITTLQGLSLRHVTLSLYQHQKLLYEDFGEMMFTHFGVTGPLVLAASSVLTDQLLNSPGEAYIDLKPALSAEQLDNRLLREFRENQNRQFKNAVSGLLPAKLLAVILDIGPIDANKKVNEILKAERLAFGALLKRFPFTVTGRRGYQEAIITKGGVAVTEVNPKTMASKKIANLYFIGEVLDTDAQTGGFNLQIAWSTAYAAANAVR